MFVCAVIFSLVKWLDISLTEHIRFKFILFVIYIEVWIKLIQFKWPELNNI